MIQPATQLGITSTLALFLALGESGQVLTDAAEQAPPPGARFKIEDLVSKTEDLSFKSNDLIFKTEDLTQAVKSLEVRETPLEVKIELAGDVLFDFDKATIRKGAEPTLRQVAAMIGKYSNANVRIDGYTDAKGSDAHNVPLSERRAASVRSWLERTGVKARFVTQGHGKADPVAPNMNPDGSDNPEGRQKNRRVEITIRKS